MVAKADVDESCGDARRRCRWCAEYDRCDKCNRRLCTYAAVHIYANGVDQSEITCRPCAETMGWSEAEIATQAIDIITGECGDAIDRDAGKEV